MRLSIEMIWRRFVGIVFFTVWASGFVLAIYVYQTYEGPKNPWYLQAIAGVLSIWAVLFYMPCSIFTLPWGGGFLNLLERWFGQSPSAVRYEVDRLLYHNITHLIGDKAKAERWVSDHSALVYSLMRWNMWTTSVAVLLESKEANERGTDKIIKAFLKGSGEQRDAINKGLHERYQHCIKELG